MRSHRPTAAQLARCITFGRSRVRPARDLRIGNFEWLQVFRPVLALCRALVADRHCSNRNRAMQAAALEDAQAADAKKRKRDLTPEHRRAQSVDPEEKLLRSDEPRSRHREAASSAWTLQLPRPLVTLLRDLCERLPVEHFITVRAVALGRSIDLSGRWTVETSHESSHVLPRWMQEPALLRPEQDGELMVTMHTHPRAAITQSLDTVPSLRRRQQLARTNPLLYVPSLADVNNMLRYGMHASIVRRRPR